MATALPQNRPSANISRLITAAVINQSFRQLLLSNPEKAITTGFNGESFRLDRDEKEMLLGIEATTLADFAVKVAGFNQPKEQAKQNRRGYTGYSAS